MTVLQAEDTASSDDIFFEYEMRVRSNTVDLCLALKADVQIGAVFINRIQSPRNVAHPMFRGGSEFAYTVLHSLNAKSSGSPSFGRWGSTNSFGGLPGATIRMKADATISARFPDPSNGGSRGLVLRVGNRMKSGTKGQTRAGPQSDTCKHRLSWSESKAVASSERPT
jgi:hypothetical protein